MTATTATRITARFSSDGSTVKLVQNEPAVLPRSFMPGEEAPSFAWLSFPAPSAAAGVWYYSIPLADKTVLGVRWNLQQLTPRPKSPNLVFLLDVSRSQQGEGLPLQLQAIESILMQAKDAKVQFVSYAREAKAQTSSWLSAADAVKLLKELKKLPLANGSSLELGLQEAAKLLSKDSGILIAFTDGGLVKSLALKTLQGSLSGISAKSVVHLVNISPGGYAEPTIDRADYPYAPDGKKELYEDQKIGEVAKKYNGMYVQYSMHKKTTLGELSRLTEHLLHPIFIDDLSTLPAPEGERWRIRGFNFFDSSVNGGPKMANDSGFSLVELQSDRKVALKDLKIQGRLWQKAWVQPVTEDKSLELYTRLVFFASSTSFFGERDATLQMAKSMGLVSDVTAYALGGSATEGSFFGRGGGFGSFGCGRGSTGDDYERKSTPVDVEKLIAKKCRGKSPMEVEIDTSNGEVLDVRVLKGSSADTKCVVEAAWALELPFDEGEETTTITK